MAAAVVLSVGAQHHAAARPKFSCEAKAVASVSRRGASPVPFSPSRLGSWPAGRCCLLQCAASAVGVRPRVGGMARGAAALQHRRFAAESFVVAVLQRAT